MSVVSMCVAKVSDDRQRIDHVRHKVCVLALASDEGVCVRGDVNAKPEENHVLYFFQVGERHEKNKQQRDSLSHLLAPLS